MLENYRQDLELIKQGKLPKLAHSEEKSATNLHSQEIKKRMDLIKQGILPELQSEDDNVFGLQKLYSEYKVIRKKDNEKQR